MSNDVANQVAALPAMPTARIEQQPAAVWRCVEETINQGWHFAAVSAWELRESKGPRPPANGWLRLEHILDLLALEVPVTRMFTGCALAQRKELRP